MARRGPTALAPTRIALTLAAAHRSGPGQVQGDGGPHAGLPDPDRTPLAAAGQLDRARQLAAKAEKIGRTFADPD